MAKVKDILKIINYKQNEKIAFRMGEIIANEATDPPNTHSLDFSLCSPFSVFPQPDSKVYSEEGWGRALGPGLTEDSNSSYHLPLVGFKCFHAIWLPYLSFLYQDLVLKRPRTPL